jgi:hypothetical protein
MVRVALLGLALALVAGCGDNGATPMDMAMFVSACGKPGDQGNSLGVGKFCTGIADCTDNPKAVLCTTLGDTSRMNFFCTMPCENSDAGGADPCGENARCACSSGGCGCFPTRCD